MALDEMPADKVRQYLKQITPQARKNLLAEIERMQMYGETMPGGDVLLAELRAEFRGSGQTHDRLGNPSRHFFQPIEALFVNRPADCTNAGQVSRGSLSPIWEWISNELLPAMTRDYCEAMRGVLVRGDQPKARVIAADFQAKVLKSLEGTLDYGGGVERTRAGLAQYTTSRAAFDDLKKIMSALRVRDALGKLGQGLPPKIDALDGAVLAKARGLLDAFAAKHGEEVPFALTVVAKRLKASWQLVHLATKAARSRKAADVAATPYAMSVTMVLDILDELRLALKQAMRSDRLQVAKQNLADIYAIEDALRRQISQLETSAWGHELDRLMAQVAADLDAEFHRLPEGTQHVLGSRKGHGHGGLASLMRKSKDALTSGYHKLVGQ